MTGKSYIILAMGESLYQYLSEFESAGYKMPADEVLAVNSVASWLSPRMFTRAIALDSFTRDQEMEGGRYKQYVANIIGCGRPVIADVEYPEWPHVTPYPLKEVVANIWPDAKCDQQCRPGLTNTIAYSTALAIYEGATSIGFFGCDFRLSDKPSMLYAEADMHQDKPFWWPYHMAEVVKYRRDHEPGEVATNFLLGVAHARGIKVFIPPQSTLLDADRAFYWYGPDKQPKIFNDGT